MFYRLKAKNRAVYNAALFDSEINGLDPDMVNINDNVFDVGTGKVEKVSRLISKYKLDILIEAEYAPNNEAYLRGGYYYYV